MAIGKQQLAHLAKKYKEEVIGIRRYLHSNPELSFEEFNTSNFIKGVLNKYKIPFTDGFVKTGIVAEIKPDNYAGTNVIAIRADIDALPIKEENNVAYKSCNEGVMHACGHDVHTASVLGTAIILNEIRNELNGIVRVIFQPGEEKLPGGASLMIKEGALGKPIPKFILGQHVFPEMKVGHAGFRKGMYMASTDEIYLKVTGKGGHAAMPSQYNSPILIASKILLELDKNFMHAGTRLEQHIPTVLAFGRFEGLGVTNVIPDHVNIQGTFRTMKEEWRRKAHMHIEAICKSVAEENHGTCEVDIRKGYPFLVNDEDLTGKIWKLAEEYLGKDHVHPLELRMTAEDFAYYSQVMPACFYRLGVRNEAKGITSAVHTPTFDIDEDALETGSGLMAWLCYASISGMPQ